MAEKAPSGWCIQADSLLVRAWRPADLPALKRFCEDPEMMRYLTDGRPWQAEEQREFMARQRRQLRRHGVCMGALCRVSGGSAIGVAGIQPHEEVAGQYELGWWVWRRYWGRGYATVIGRALLSHAFTVMALDRVVAISDPGNRASRRVMEKLGMRFQRAALAREFSRRYPDRPVVLYELARSEWQRFRL